MKRSILALVLAVGAGIFVPASAACDGPSVITGQYDTAHAVIGDVTIHVEGYTRTFTSNSVQACSDGTVTNDEMNAHLTMKVGEAVVCDRADYPMDADPFSFGDSHRNTTANPDPEGESIPNGPCGVDMAWSFLLPTFGPGIEGIAAGVAYAQVGIRKDVPVAGRYWHGGGAPVGVPVGLMGYFTRGARADVIP